MNWDLQIPQYYTALSILCQLQLLFLNLDNSPAQVGASGSTERVDLCICFPTVHTTGEGEAEKSLTFPWASVLRPHSSTVSGDCSPNFKYPLYPCHLVTLYFFQFLPPSCLSAQFSWPTSLHTDSPLFAFLSTFFVFCLSSSDFVLERT